MSKHCKYCELCYTAKKKNLKNPSLFYVKGRGQLSFIQVQGSGQNVISAVLLMVSDVEHSCFVLNDSKTFSSSNT